MQPQILSGARCTVSIGGKQVAAAFVADYNIETQGREIETIDSVIPAEIAPGRIRVTMGLRVYRTPDNDPVQAGYVAGSANLGEVEQQAFMSGKYITIEIKDDRDNTVLYIPKAWIARRSGGMSVGDFLTEQWTIIGIGYSGPSL